MTEIHGRRCGATRAGHYFLDAAGASWRVLSSRVLLLLPLLLLGVGCGNEEARPTESSAIPRGTASAETLSPQTAPVEEAPAVVFLGTSLTAGYGLPEDQAFPALIQQRIDAAGLDYRVVNAGVSGDTSAGGLRRLDWLLRLPIEVLVVELGANDMLRGQSIEALEQNLDAIVEKTAGAHPQARILIVGMRAAPNLGPDYQDAFDDVYPALARRHDAALIPFLLEDVAARPTLNQNDGIHPTAEGHALIAERVWQEIEPLLRSNPTS